MAQNNQPLEGNALIECKVTIGQKKVLTFSPEAVILVDAEIVDDVYGNGTSLLTFSVLDPGFVESLKQVMSNADPALEFRLGFGSPSGMYWLPWQRHIIVNYPAKFEGIGTSGGNLIVLKTANNFVRMERSNKVLARKGAISDIIKTIATENSMESVVEPTDGKFILYQSFLDDTRFIRQRCLPRAITVKGRGGFYFYIRDNVLHFHTPDFQGNVVDMNYYRTFSTELLVTDMSQEPALWDGGIAGVRVITQNPLTAQTKEVSSHPENAIKLADSIYKFDNVANGAWNVPYHFGFNPALEADAIAQFVYQMARQKTFNCSVTVDKIINIRHGDLLNLIITQQTSKASSHSGYYYVTRVSRMIKKQAVSSVYTLERGELRGQQQSLSVQDRENQLVSDTQAPGQTPNILEMQSSELTKGAGKESSARTYSVVTDANTGK